MTRARLIDTLALALLAYMLPVIGGTIAASSDEERRIRRAGPTAEEIVRRDIARLQDAALGGELGVTVCSGNGCFELSGTQAHILVFMAIEAARGSLAEIRRQARANGPSGRAPASRRDRR